ncbi:MAG: TIGR04133 family radical SAM/SPASM protein [Bacteroidaceae bacterium]|nr:TIGR04133 family radical SAM/SPASM protein [Bacteroidaceae bacterium]
MKLKQKLVFEIDRLRRENLKELHPLRQLFWECTLRCNLHCLHCGSDCKNIATTPDMPAEDFLKAVDQVLPHVDPHKLMVIISGGEPLVRKDLEEVGRELHRREMPWGMVSNGLLLTPERLQSLMAAGLTAMTISLDGMEEDHNWMRGNPASFQCALRAISLLSQTRLAWDVVTCVNRRNVKYLPELRQLLIEVGVKHWRLFTIFPVGRAKEHPDLQLPDDDFRYLLDFIAENRKQPDNPIELQFACEGFLGDYEGKVRNNLYQCHAGITVASVLIDGSISACTSIRSKFYQGNIYQDNLWEVWENRFENYRNRSWAKQGECADCDMFRYCEGNGMHLHDEEGKLLLCHLKRLK